MSDREPAPEIGQIEDAFSELQGAIKEFWAFLPQEFQYMFIGALERQARSLQELFFNNFLRAAESVHKGDLPDLPNTEFASLKGAVAGMPVWKAEPLNPMHAFRFSDYVPNPDEAEIVVYLDKYNDQALQAVQNAAIELCRELGYDGFTLMEEQFGSIFQRFHGKLRGDLVSDFFQQKMQELDERTSIEIVGRARAETDAIKTANAVNLIASLADIPNAIVRVGGLLIIKQTDAIGASGVITRELSTREIRALELNPGIQRDPHQALQLLALAVAELEEGERDVDRRPSTSDA
jgi:hypothetical protein